jgi:hypothetical protein
MKKKNLGIVDVIVSGDLVFLASAFCDEATLVALDGSYDELMQRMKPSTTTGEVSLESIANFDPAVLSRLLRNMVSHPKDTAQRSIVEAQFWMRFLSGAES